MPKTDTLNAPPLLETIAEVERLLNVWRASDNKQEESLAQRELVVALDELYCDYPGLLMDGVRLEWMERNLTLIRDIGWVSGRSLRSVIDQAMKETK